MVSTTPRPLYPRERPGTHCTGGWVGPQGRSGRVRKISPPPGFDPRTVQPVASRYTDCAIPTRRHLNLSTPTHILSLRSSFLLSTFVSVSIIHVLYHNHYHRPADVWWASQVTKVGSVLSSCLVFLRYLRSLHYPRHPVMKHL